MEIKNDRRIAGGRSSCWVMQRMCPIHVPLLGMARDSDKFLKGMKEVTINNQVYVTGCVQFRMTLFLTKKESSKWYFHMEMCGTAAIWYGILYLFNRMWKELIFSRSPSTFYVKHNAELSVKEGSSFDMNTQRMD